MVEIFFLKIWKNTCQFLLAKDLFLVFTKKKKKKKEGKISTEIFAAIAYKFADRLLHFLSVNFRHLICDFVTHEATDFYGV